ncbi:MAG: hypothetical protein M9911_09135 [Saprospiraceae bacterium]|jgi:hypothetical protein|nr:hypothetical protein [Saprospiraceae bacterium]
MKTFSRLLAFPPLNPLKGTLPVHRISRHRAGYSPFTGLGGKTLILALLIIFTATSCEKEEPKNCCSCPVPYSESGSNTMGCLMDDQPWAVCDVANKTLGANAFVTIETFNWFNIRCEKNYNGGRELLKVGIKNPHIGILPYKNFDTFNSAAYVYGEFFTEIGTRKGIYLIDTTSFAQIEVTRFDTIQRIISGRFECTLIENDGGIDTAKIKLTDGVFDAKF